MSLANYMRGGYYSSRGVVSSLEILDMEVHRGIRLLQHERPGVDRAFPDYGAGGMAVLANLFQSGLSRTTGPRDVDSLGQLGFVILPQLRGVAGFAPIPLPTWRTSRPRDAELRREEKYLDPFSL
jgi:hypothetical protein